MRTRSEHMTARNRLLFALTAGALVAGAGCTNRPIRPPYGLPAWLQQQVSDGGRFPPVIEETTYNGRLAYHILATDRYDTGDEHSLFTADGRLICRFGGVAGVVTSGSCDLDRIVYVRTVYDPAQSEPAA